MLCRIGFWPIVLYWITEVTLDLPNAFALPVLGLFVLVAWKCHKRRIFQGHEPSSFVGFSLHAMAFTLHAFDASLDEKTFSLILTWFSTFYALWYTFMKEGNNPLLTLYNKIGCASDG